jgi:hypothetical protein
LFPPSPDPHGRVPPLLWVDDDDDDVLDDDERMDLMTMTTAMTFVSFVCCGIYEKTRCFYFVYRRGIGSTTTHWRWIVFSQFFGDDAWIYHVCVYESCFCWNS